MLLFQTFDEGVFLDNMLERVAYVVPHIFMALIALVLGWIISRIIENITRKIFKKLGFDKLADRIGQFELVAISKITIKPSKLLSKFLFYVLMLLVIIISTDILGMEKVSEALAEFLGHTPQLLMAFIIFLIGVFIADFVTRIVASASKSIGVQRADLVAKFVFYFMILNVAIIALDQAGIQTDFLQENIYILFGGIILAFAIGYGLATKDLVANLLSGYYYRNRVHIGDQISIDGVSGKVVDIKKFSFILQAEGKRYIIPLNKLSDQIVEIHE